MNQIGLDLVATSVFVVFTVDSMEFVKKEDVFVLKDGEDLCATSSCVMKNVKIMVNVSMEAVSVNKAGMEDIVVLMDVVETVMAMESVNSSKHPEMIIMNGDVNVRMDGVVPSVIRDKKPTVRMKWIMIKVFANIVVLLSGWLLINGLKNFQSLTFNLAKVSL